jgi:hypothetical protein
VSADVTAARRSPGGRLRPYLTDVLLLRRAGSRATVIWLALGSVLAEFTRRVTDYADFDAARYERLAISVAETHSIVPRINGQNIHYVSMLYPLLIAPFFAGAALWKDLQNAQVASAYIMASACVPAFLLTRRLSRVWWAPYFVGVFSVCMPWIVTSVSLMTEVSSYPASIWALYAIVVATSSPSKLHDGLALVAILLAFLARGELITLLFVFPAALVAFEVGRTEGDAGRRLRQAGRSLVQAHPVLVAVYAVLGCLALGLEAAGRLSSLIGIYSVYSKAGHIVWGALPRALAEHVATFSLGVGVVPAVVALAWIGVTVVRPVTNRDAHAFACVSAVMLVVVFVQATNFDLVVNAYIHDRFLMYFVPVMLVGSVLAVTEPRRLRWSLIPPVAVMVAGFAFGVIPPVTWSQFPWLDIDTPISTVYRVLAAHLGGLTPARVVLILITVCGTAVVLALREFGMRSGSVALVVFGWCAVAMVFSTNWAFVRAFDAVDRNGRSLTGTLHGQVDWIDAAVGSGARVTAIQYPVSSDWFVNEKAWVDYEYFNKSLVRDARIAGADPFDYTGFWFPKLDLHFDSETGTVAESPTSWVATSVGETRFRLVGTTRFTEQNVELIKVQMPWRLAWLTSGMYDDGWTKPGVSAEMRLYPAPGQQTPVLRGVTFIMRSPSDVARRTVTVSAQGRATRAVVTPGSTNAAVQVCVPPHGFATIRLTVSGSSSIPGDQATLADSLTPRAGGVYVASIGEADEIGPKCSVPSSS